MKIVCVCERESYVPFQAAQAFPFIVVRDQPTMQFVFSNVLQSVCASVSSEMKHAGNTRAPGSLWSLQEKKKKTVPKLSPLPPTEVCFLRINKNFSKVGNGSR